MFKNKYNKRQLEIVEFSEKVYHAKLRHKGINGALYEDVLIKYLREDLKEFSFFKGQIIDENSISSQFDIIIAKKNTEQTKFIKSVNPYISAVNIESALGVIELKKWGNPKMIAKEGVINSEYRKFKKKYSELSYLFVSLRFKDRISKIENNWINLKKDLETDGKFCFFGRTSKKNKEWEPWLDNKKLLEENEKYQGEYEKLILKIKTLSK